VGNPSERAGFRRERRTRMLMRGYCLVNRTLVVLRLHFTASALRDSPLIERKRHLRRIIPAGCDAVLYVDHIEGDGERLFELARQRDLEGIVAKHRLSRYTTENHNPAWAKIRNRRYSQMIGRDELFERRYEAKGAPDIGWHVCDRACAAATGV